MNEYPAIVADLRSEDSDLCQDAADEIEEQFLELKEAASRISTLEAENKRLREALRPFAEFPSHGVCGGPLCCARGIYEDGTDENTARHRGDLDPKDFARARAALHPTASQEGEG